VLALITGGTAGLALILWTLSYQKYVLGSVLLLSVATTISLGITAHLGGKVRHTEFNTPQINGVYLVPKEEVVEVTKSSEARP